jgi:hypothetical protein
MEFVVGQYYLQTQNHDKLKSMGVNANMLDHKTIDQVLAAVRRGEVSPANQTRATFMRSRDALHSCERISWCTGLEALEAAQLRLALGSLLHSRLASRAAIEWADAPALVDLLFEIATKPPLQSSAVSLKVLTFRWTDPRGRGYYLQRETDIKEHLLPARMPLAELLRTLEMQFPREHISFKAQSAPLRATLGCMLRHLDGISTVKKASRAEAARGFRRQTIEQFVTAGNACLIVVIEIRERSRSRDIGRFDIGHFASHHNTPGRRYLSDNGATYCTLNNLNTLLTMVPGASRAATFRRVIGPVITPHACATLVQHLDQLKYGYRGPSCARARAHTHIRIRFALTDTLYQNLSIYLFGRMMYVCVCTRRREHNGQEAVEDLQVELTARELARLIGDAQLVALQETAPGFATSCTTIKLRRCSAVGKCINFHTDVSKRTMQVALSAPESYGGGELIYANAAGLHVPPRPIGSATIHGAGARRTFTLCAAHLFLIGHLCTQTSCTASVSSHGACAMVSFSSNRIESLTHLFDGSPHALVCKRGIHCPPLNFPDTVHDQPPALHRISRVRLTSPVINAILWHTS